MCAATLRATVAAAVRAPAPGAVPRPASSRQRLDQLLLLQDAIVVGVVQHKDGFDLGLPPGFCAAHRPAV